MDIVSAPMRGKFPRVVMPFIASIDSDEAAPYVEEAVEIADLLGSPVHIQNLHEITVHIIHPEDPS